MFSNAARAKMMERGWSLTSFLLFFRDSAVESRENARAQRAKVVAVVRFSSLLYIATVVLAVSVYGSATVASFLRFAAYTALGVVAFTVWIVASIGLVRGQDGRVVGGVGLANYLTIARFHFIVPVLILFVDGHYAASLALYLLLGLTDIADGMIARVRDESTEFGVVMDPLADVFSTAAVFALFTAQGLVPQWLFLILLARYLLLLVGSFVLFLAVGPIKFKATIPGKIVGLIQGAGIMIVIASALSASGWLDRVSPVLFPMLGISFATIVLSQVVIGTRHIRMSAAQRGKAVQVGRS